GLLGLGYGLTEVLRRGSAAADELSEEEVVAGGRQLRARVRKYRPRYLAVLGVGAYRIAFARPRATLGLQPETIGETKLWVLPNPSGLNAHYQTKELTRVFKELRE